MFDLLKLGNVDLRGEPFSKRKRPWRGLLEGHQRVLYVDHMEREGLAICAGAVALGLEGVVAKDSNSPHIEGPSENRFCLKIKNRDFMRRAPFGQNKRG